ncbi:MAG TPA: 4-(cytidine 5'-diphospho)-2-C-methyl-D-erythritol kinase, partial [Candidatus Acidoferrales bacterium]|nr:4-(cytidine 5'-diphospho)-2-C-methyl-D-erythritol kinase [Candidatus Acidoferrales bacterium]
MKSVRVPAYAKVNLRLEVLGRRADGYHELRTIFQAISLHDVLALETMREPGIDLRIAGNSELAGEPGKDNLVYRAIEELGREIDFRQGVRAVLTKRIPVGRGLGGGSSDAAAALLGLLRLAAKRVEPARLLEIASGLGADVPFFLQGGRAFGIGRGDEIYPLPDVPRRALLVISPHEIAVPTKDAYQWLSEELTNKEDPTKLMRFCALCWSPQRGALSNDFEAAVFPRYPRLAAIKRELLQQGAAEASLAGSGSAVFGVYQHPAKARRAARAFPRDQVFLCS